MFFDPNLRIAQNIEDGTLQQPYNGQPKHRTNAPHIDIYKEIRASATNETPSSVIEKGLAWGFP